MKSNLRQFGSWDSKLDAKACEVLALRYAEVLDTFDYTVCQRPNGTYYGIATGKQCQKGRQVNRVAVLGALAKRGIPREVLGKIAKAKDDKKFGKAVQALNSGRKKISADAIKPTKPTAAPKVAPTKPTGEKMTASQRKARLEELRAEREARRGQSQAKRNIRERKKAEEVKKTGAKPKAEEQKKPIAKQQQTNKPAKVETTPALKAGARDFANSEAFKQQLPSNNEQYLAKSAKDLHKIDFVDLKQTLGQDVVASMGVPEKYLDTLSRGLVTKTAKGTTDNWRHYGEGQAGGAGRIQSQMGELMTLTMASLGPADRVKLYNTISERIDAAQKSGAKLKDLTITKDWLDASMSNARAIDRYMKIEAPGARVVGGAWDVKGELKALGIGQGGEKKGFSTDIVVRDSNGKNHQLSLKKDGNVNFLNSGAGQYTGMMLTGAAENPRHPKHAQAKEYVNTLARINQIYADKGLGEVSPTPPTQKALKALGLADADAKATARELKQLNDTRKRFEGDDKIVPRGYNMAYYNNRENAALNKNFSALRDDIAKLRPSDLVTAPDQRFLRMINDANFSPEVRAKFLNPDGSPRLDPKTGNIKPLPPGKKVDSQQYEAAKTMLAKANEQSRVASELLGSMDKAGASAKWRDTVDKIAAGDTLGLDRRSLNKLMLNAILATDTPQADRHRAEMYRRSDSFSRAALGAIQNDKTMQAGVLATLRNNFPLKDVAEGSESMIIGNAAFSKAVVRRMFGTDNFDQIREGLVVQAPSGGTPFLGYQASVGGKTIPIADISIRPDGLGYGNTMKHEMKLRPDFYKLLQEENTALEEEA
jgi:hypothetical protein